jgi:hypothetical protein
MLWAYTRRAKSISLSFGAIPARITWTPAAFIALSMAFCCKALSRSALAMTPDHDIPRPRVDRHGGYRQQAGKS